MGRGTQLFEFLRSEEMPTAMEIKHRFTSLSITPELKKFRKKWRTENKAGLLAEADPQVKLFGKEE